MSLHDIHDQGDRGILVASPPPPGECDRTYTGLGNPACVPFQYRSGLGIIGPQVRDAGTSNVIGRKAVLVVPVPPGVGPVPRVVVENEVPVEIGKALPQGRGRFRFDLRKGCRERLKALPGPESRSDRGVSAPSHRRIGKPQPP